MPFNSLDGIALRNFRGIGPSAQRLASCVKMNLLIGANNSGKSAFLTFLAQQLCSFSPQLPQRPHVKQRNTLSPLDVHQGALKTDVAFALGIHADKVHAHLLGVSKSLPSDDKQRVQRVNGVMKLLSDNGVVWLEFDGCTHQLKGLLEPTAAISPSTTRDVEFLWRALNPGSSGGNFDLWMEAILVNLMHSFEPLETCLIPAIRQIGKAGESFDDMSGKGLIDQLAEVQSPRFEESHRKELFVKINDFLKSVTDDPTARLEIPHTRENILVHLGNRHLPLESLGTGIHEITMLAAFCTLTTKKIVCIEEPEIHLHPLLQRKLMRYLQDKTENQYFIATHSAALIDMADAAVFHVDQQNGQTCVKRAASNLEKHAICADLGYRASDILQANAVVWVEGPSDRIYVNYWLRSVAPHLIEGVHYSVMFYGGRLLSHLSADDEEVTEFIQLRRLNRHLAVIMDSDRASPRHHINETKKRILKDFKNGVGMAWVTKGREIENYIAPDRIKSALEQLYPKRFAEQISQASYDHALHFRQQGSKQGTVFKDADKVKVAKIVATKAPSFPLDLRDRVAQLVTMIEAANQ